MILDVGRIRVTFVAIRTLYTTYTAQMTYVIIEIFPPFEPLPASIAVQIVAVEIRIRIFHATNLVFLFARVPHVERQISLLGERLAALRTLYSVRPCTGRRVFPFFVLLHVDVRPAHLAVGRGGARRADHGRRRSHVIRAGRPVGTSRRPDDHLA